MEKSNIVNLGLQKRRVNSAFYRAELMTTECPIILTNAVPQNQLIIMTPIHMNSRIYDIKIQHSGGATDTYDLHLCQLKTNPQNVTAPVDIKILLNITLAASKYTLSEDYGGVALEIKNKTLFELCHTYNQATGAFDPDNTFKPYKNLPKLFLALAPTIGAGQPVGTRINMRIDFVENTPSTAAPFGIAYDGQYTSNA